jgi:hypothetical protein
VIAMLARLGLDYAPPPADAFPSRPPIAYGTAMRALLLLALLALPACHKAEPETVQQRAANASVRLEQRYNELEAEAGNDVAEQSAPAENEAEALLNQINATTPADAGANAAVKAR